MINHITGNYTIIDSGLDTYFFRHSSGRTTCWQDLLVRTITQLVRHVCLHPNLQNAGRQSGQPWLIHWVARTRFLVVSDERTTVSV